MNTSIGFRFGSAILIVTLVITAFNFSLIPVQAGSDAEDAVKKAQQAVQDAETAARAADEVSANFGTAVGLAAERPGTVPDLGDEGAAKAASDAGMAAEDAQDKAQKARNEGADNQKDAEEKAKAAEEEAAKKEKEADEAAKKARADDKEKMKDQQVTRRTDARNLRKRLRAARRRARQVRRAAAQAIIDAEKAIAQQAARIGGNPETIQELEKELEALRKRMRALVESENLRLYGSNPPPPENFIPQGNIIPQEPGSGIQTGEFKVPGGRIIVTLPDDIRAGDTISGTVSVEPNGQTPDEKANNRRKLGDYMIMVPFRPVRPDPKADANPNILSAGSITGIVVNPNGPPRVGAGFYIQDPEPDQGTSTSEGVFVFTPIHGSPAGNPVAAGPTPKPTPNPTTQQPAPPKFDLRLYQLPNQDSPLGPCSRLGSLVTINEGCKPVSQLVFTPPTIPPIIIDPPAADPIFTVPALGQNGRPVVINGPFDGNSTNTGVRIHQFMKVSDSVDGLEPIRPIAESPRKAVFISPPNVTGPMQITVNDGGKQTIAPFRNVGVNLVAPKTNLAKGEQTTLTIQVTGLQGITTNVPLILTCNGVVTMQGGMSQQLVIQPSQVGPGGIYTITRDITGAQAGGWGATATVVTNNK